MKHFKKAICLLTSAILALSSSALSGGLTVFAENDNEKGSEILSEGDYLSYYNSVCNEKRAENTISLSYSSAIERSGQTYGYNGTEYPVINETDNFLEWNFSVESEAVYSLGISYIPLKSDNGNDITFSFLTDGGFAYTDCKSFTLRRMYKNLTDKIATSKNGDDIKPEQVQVENLITADIYDMEGMFSEPYLLKLSKGNHSIRLEHYDGDFAVSEISLKAEKKALSYSDYIKQFSNLNIKGETEILQAEKAVLKNSSVLYPTYDNSTCEVTPNSCSNVKLNTIGQENWNINGQTIYWEVPVKKEGLYKISFHANQDFKPSLDSYRTLTVNGEVPFKEAESIAFSSSGGWYNKTFGDDKPYLLHLKQGDILGLTVTTGEMSKIIRELRSTVLNLNKVYRSVVTITGSSPDKYQDYSLEKRLPNLVDDLNANITALKSTEKEIVKILGTTGGQTSIIKRVYQDLSTLASDTYYVPQNIGLLSGAIEDLGSIVTTIAEQPLELDSISFTPSDEEIAEIKKNFFEKLVFNLKRFVYSFKNDNNENNKSSAKTIKVWAATGRDQAQILENMINDTFEEKYGINVELSLVGSGTNLKEATIAGKGPDVSLMIDQKTPIELAVRGALVDLSKYDFSQIKGETEASAWKPFEYNGGVYAVPETQVFNVMFYRTDVFKSLNLQPPKTWEEFYSTLEILQRNNLEVGIQEVDSGNAGVSAGIATFNMFLFQNGGDYFNKNFSKTRFDEEAAYKSFSDWINLYKKYKLDRDFNFFNRFRNGEMPLAISGYSSYFQLKGAAPEINGLWSFAEVPGTVKSDGTIDRSQSSTVTGSVILKGAEKRGVVKEAVEFVKWWTSSQSQTRYGDELEASLGITARYTPANKVALNSLGWTKEEKAVLLSALKNSKNTNEIPGSYMISRSLTNAMRSVLDDTYTARRALIVYNYDMNNEITRKRNEFGIK